MAFNLCQSSVKITVAQICQSLGWNSVMATPLDLLVDIMERYLMSIGRTTQRYSEQFGRSDASYGDALLALTDMGVCLPELLDYMKNVDAVEFPKKVPAFPAPKSCKLIYSDDAGDDDALESGRSPQHSVSVGESLSSGVLAVNRRSLTTSSADQPWQPRPLQELSNSEFRARCRQLLDSDSTDIEEKLSKAPDPRPPLQMAQIMRQRRPALSIPPISISGVTSSMLVLNTGLGSSSADPAHQLAGGDLPEPLPAKVKKDRTSLVSSSGPGAASKGSATKRRKTGGSGKAASASSKSSSDPKRREKAAAAKQRKRDQGYTALAEALTAAPLQCPPATSTAAPSAASAQPTVTDWQGTPSLPSSVPPSRSASRHAALGTTHEPAGAAGGSAGSPSPSVSHSRGTRGATTAHGVAPTSAYMRHLDDTFDAVIRGAAGVSSGDENGDRGVEEGEEEEEDVDVEALNQSHEQLASPPPHLLPLSTTSTFALLAQLPASRARSTVDDVIDSVARGDDIGLDHESSNQTPPVSLNSTSKAASGERPRKRKKKSKSRSKTLQPLPTSKEVVQAVSGEEPPASAVEEEEEGDDDNECHADVSTVASINAGSPPLPAQPPPFSSSPVASPTAPLGSMEHLDIEVLPESAVAEPSVDIVDEDMEVVQEVEVGIDTAIGSGAGPPLLQAVSGLSIAGEGLRSAQDGVPLASDDGFPARLSGSFDGAKQELAASLSGEAVAEKKKEKHKKEKKKKKNKEKHRDRRDREDGGGNDAASHGSPAQGHKDHRKSEKEYRHKHHHHHRHRTDGGSRDDERRHKHSGEHATEHRHKAKDKPAVHSGSEAEGKHKATLATEVTSTAAPVPKLLFKIAGKTISTVSQADTDSSCGGGGAAATPVTSFPSDRLSTHAASAPPTPPAAAPRGKATEIYTETEFTGTREVVDTVQETDDNKVWICPGCHQPDDGSPMIGCDKCEEWYHWTCVGIVVAPPDDATWYCPRCVIKKPAKKKAKH